MWLRADYLFVVFAVIYIYIHTHTTVCIPWRLPFNIYVLLNIVMVIKSRRMRSTEHSARMGVIKTYTILVSEPNENNIKVNLIETDEWWVSKYGPVAGSCENDFKLTASIRGGEFNDKLSGYQRQIPQISLAIFQHSVREVNCILFVS
jgi:hypothetical protein